MEILNCRSCSEKNFIGILDLGDHPWCNDFLNEGEVAKTYPLHLVQCTSCKLLQLTYTVSKETMFKNHTYLSTTETLRKHFLNLAIENKEQFGLNESDLIVDIGGNNGLQLIQYQSVGLPNVINVESADNIAEISINNGVETINEFFNEEMVNKHISSNTVKLINASGVFFHLEELHSVIRGIIKCLRDDGVLVVQFMYAGTMIDKLNFDGIYHEHLCFYTLKSLSNLLKPYGLEIFDAYFSEIHSGSIISKITYKDGDLNKKTDRYYTTLLMDEKYDTQSFLRFGEIVKSKKYDLKEFLNKLKIDGKKIYAYGAPAKGNTLLNFCEIDNKLIDKAVEINELKVGKFMPKSNIPIVVESKDDLPDYYLILAHNFADEIISRNKEIIEKGVKFIIPFPELKIIV